MLLTVQQCDELLAALNENQREFLTNQLVHSRRTAFANAVAKEKYHILIPSVGSKASWMMETSCSLVPICQR